MSMLDDLGLATTIWPMPVEIPDAIPFADDRVHARYDRDAVQRFWLALVDDAPGVQRVPEPLRRQGQPRALLLGRPRPRLHPLLGTAGAPASGRRPELRAARDVGGVLPRGQQLRLLARAARRGRRVLRLRLPGAARLPRHASSRPPVPAGTTTSAEFVLPYELVRTADDPDGLLLAFLQSTYEAAATTAQWERHRARTTGGSET